MSELFDNWDAVFQSTLPAGGATPYPVHWQQPDLVSIHAPRRGSDGASPNKRENWVFQSTLPAGGATKRIKDQPKDYLCFNPRSPQGERPAWDTYRTTSSPFQSTLPAGGATWRDRTGAGWTMFQSTLPAGGATGGLPEVERAIRFQSTLPAGGATTPAITW